MIWGEFIEPGKHAVETVPQLPVQETVSRSPPNSWNHKFSLSTEIFLAGSRVRFGLVFCECASELFSTMKYSHEHFYERRPKTQCENLTDTLYCPELDENGNSLIDLEVEKGNFDLYSYYNPVKKVMSMDVLDAIYHPNFHIIHI